MPNAALQGFCEGNDERIDALAQTFGAYQPQGVDRPRISRWLGQFDAQHYDVALRLLESVEYYNIPRMQILLRNLHEAVVDQIDADRFTEDNVYYVPTGDAGESGHEVARRYRDVNNIPQQRLKFVSDLQNLVYSAAKAKERIALVFLDDFIGSGTQVTGYWKQVLVQNVPPLAPLPKLYFGCCAACEEGVAKVQADTPLQVIPIHYLNEQVYLDRNSNFTGAEKNVIRGYCDHAGNDPKGFGGLELLLAFAYGSPDNTLSVLRGSKKQRPWRGILPRYKDLY